MSLLLHLAIGSGTVPPDVPANLTAIAVSDTQIDLTWDSVLTADGYEYRVDGGAPVDVGSALGDSVTGLTADTEYDFEVRAYDALGIRSAWSSVVSEFTEGGTAPGNIAGLKIWWKMDALSLSDGDPISSCTDFSSSGLYPGVATGSQRPTYKTNIVNGLAIARCDGTAQFFDIATMPSLTEGEAFIVFKLDADPPAVDAQTGFWALGTDGSGTHLPYTDGDIYDSFGTTSRKNTGFDTGGTLDTGFHIYSAYSAANDWSAFLDGTELTGFPTGTNTVGFPAAGAVGRHGNSSYKLDGDIAEFLLFDHKLSSGDRTAVMTYLQDKYAL